MATSFRARRYNFDWRGFITPGVKLLVLICTGVFLVQTLIRLVVSLLRACRPRSDPRSPAVAAVHVHFSPRRLATFADEHAFSLDVWPGTGARLGEKTFSEFLFSVRRRRRTDRDSGQSNSDVLGPHAVGCSDDRSFRRDFRNSHGQRNSLPRPAHLAFSFAGYDSHAALRRGDGRD